MYFDYSQKKDKKFYNIALPLIKAFSHLRFSARYKGRENIPKKGGFIVAANHITFSDPAVIIAGFPHTIHFMAKSELFENPILSLAVRNLNAFPVRRGFSDRKAISYAIEVLKSGGVLGIFPEGRRVRSAIPEQAKTGVAFIAKMTGADVLPVSLFIDPEEDIMRPNITVTFGKVIKNEELGFEKEKGSLAVKNAANIIMKRITDLWESEYENKGS